MIINIIGSILLLLGCVVFMISLLGVFRFKYVLNRIHATAVGDVLGTLLVVSGLILLRGIGFVTLKFILVLVVFWITGPVATHRIGRVEATTNLSVHDEYEVER